MILTIVKSVQFINDHQCLYIGVRDPICLAIEVHCILQLDTVLHTVHYYIIRTKSNLFFLKKRAPYKKIIAN